MDEYLKTMENYSPVADATSQIMRDIKITQMSNVPDATEL